MASDMQNTENDPHVTQELLFTLLDQSQTAILVTDVEGRIQLYNSLTRLMFSRFLDNDPREGVNLFDLIPEKRIGNFVEHFHTARGGEPVQSETSVVDNAGVQHWFQVMIAPLQEGRQQIKRICITIQMIDRIKEAEHRYYQLVERLPDGVYRSTPDGRLLTVNTALVSMLGYNTREELLEQDIVQDLFYDAGERQKSLDSNQQPAILRLKKKDGNLIWVEDACLPVTDKEGNTLFYEGVLREITERKRAEDLIRNIAEGVSAETGVAYFESLVSHLADALEVDYAVVCELDDTQVNYWRPLALHGIPEGYTKEFYNFNNGRLVRALEKHDMVLYSRNECEDFPGNEFLIELQAESFLGIRLQSYTGQTIGMLAVINRRPFRNTNLIMSMIRIFASRASAELERRMYENELIEAKEKAQQMNRMKTTFLANMSHEIRTPLNSILGFADLLREELKDQEHEIYTQRIKQGGQRLLNTINDLLDLAKIEANKTELNIQTINLAEHLNNTAGMMKGLAVHKDLVLKTHIQDEQICAHLDRNMLDQVLNNVIGNALKFTEQGTVTLNLYREQHENRNQAVIEVTDTGVGIYEDFIPHIFDEFKQESEGMNRVYEGTGLGLTLTRKYVELMGGQIEVTSRKGKGSVFRIRFNEARDVQQGGDRSAAEHPGKALQTQERYFGEPDVKAADSGQDKQARLLLVEDNPDNMEVTVMLLEPRYSIDTASNADEALERIQKHRYDGLLIDINLGTGMNGHELLKKIRSQPVMKQIPAVAVTAYSMPADREKYLSYGFDEYIAKPFNRDEIIRALSAVLSDPSG